VKAGIFVSRTALDKGYIALGFWNELNATPLVFRMLGMNMPCGPTIRAQPNFNIFIVSEL
jgi:hypothetical protein